MNVTHPNYGQNYQLTRAALRLGTFTVSELEDLTGAAKNTVYSFVSKLRQVRASPPIDEGMLISEELQSLRGRPQKRYSLTDAGTKYLAELSFELASRFGEDSESSRQRQTRAEATEGIFLPSDIYEEDRELVVQVEVPGLSEEDVDVRIEHNDLVVSGERPALLRRRGATPYMIERQHGRFVRAYPLPETVEAIRNVEVRNGVLEVVLEKAASSIGRVREVVAEQRSARARAQSVASAAFHHHEETAGS
jgi:HSP20 family protein